MTMMTRNSATLLSIVLVVFFICIFKIRYRDHDEIYNISHRYLQEGHGTLPKQTQWYEFPGKLVENTTNSNLPSLFEELLKSYLPSSTDVKELKNNISLISQVIDDLESSLNISVKSDAKNKESTIVNNIAPLHEGMGKGVNNYHHFIENHKFVGADRKKLEDHVIHRGNHLDDNNIKAINEMFDIIVLTGKDYVDVNFLENWKHLIEFMHVIIIQQGDPHRFITIPDWVDYELYNKIDIIASIGDDAWIVDIENDGPQGYNFGFLVSDREYVYLLDRFCVPIKPPPNASEGESLKYNIFRLHAMNLVRPSTPFYYHNPHKDPFKNGNDFPSGYPYSLRDGLATGVSFGSIESITTSDSLTQLYKSYSGYPQSKANQSSVEHNNEHRNKDISVSIPQRVLFSLMPKNIAFNRKIIGSAFIFVGAAASRTKPHNLGSNYDVLMGWMLKTVLDHMDIGVKNIIEPCLLYDHSKMVLQTDSPNSSFKIFNSLKDDYLWLQNSEEIVRYFSELKLPVKSREVASSSIEALVGMMRNDLFPKFPFLSPIADIVTTYTKLFNWRNMFHIKLLPVASRAKKGPDSGHQCAAFTISHNETDMLEVWLRYYSKHLPVWILNHHSGKDESVNELRISKELIKQSNVSVIELYGDHAGFPMGFFITQADLHQYRLFRYGFKCVLLSDVDEIVVPDPTKYPHGLKEYLTNFANDPNRKYQRVNSYLLAHISLPNGDDMTNVEQPVNWSQSILAQRHYWTPVGFYNKPLLSKIPLRYKAGFHNTYISHPIPVDYDLIMLHLKEFDQKFCVDREFIKHQLVLRSHQSEIDAGLNGHIHDYSKKKDKGELCQFAMGTYYKNSNAALDNTGRVRLERMEDKWNLVDM
eukprot:gene8289-11219_t